MPSVLHDTPSYPYGLCLCLDSETFKKLNMKVPILGEKFILHAMVEVSSLSQSSYKGDEKNVNVSLQITEMELEKQGTPAEEVIY